MNIYEPMNKSALIRKMTNDGYWFFSYLASTSATFIDMREFRRKVFAMFTTATYCTALLCSYSGRNIAAL